MIGKKGLRASIGIVVFGAVLATASRAEAEVLAYMYAVPTDPQQFLFEPWRFNAANGTNRVTRQDVGRYTVELPGLAGNGGTVHVSAIGDPLDGIGWCKVVSWWSSGSSELVSVACYAYSGERMDTRFSLMFVRPNGQGPLGYVWADRMTATSYTPNLRYQYNSTGATNTVTKWGTGDYTVRLPGLTDGRHVQVTAYGSNNNWCKVGWFSNGSAAALVNVRCFTPSGAPGDTPFTMSYVGPSGLFRPSPGGMHGGYALANQPTRSSSYVPDTNYQFVTYAPPITISRVDVGKYTVNFTWQSGEGTVQVTAYGLGSERCLVAGWSSYASVDVRCMSLSGFRADAHFEVMYVTARPRI